MDLCKYLPAETQNYFTVPQQVRCHKSKIKTEYIEKERVNISKSML